MSSNALESQGMTLALGDGASPEVFTGIAEISSIQGPGGNATLIDVSDLASTGREKRLGLQDEGQVTFDLNFLPKNTQHAALRTAKKNRTKHNFRITFTDSSPSTTWTFAAFVMNVSISNAVDDVTKGQVTLEITGSITEA